MNNQARALFGIIVVAALTLVVQGSGTGNKKEAVEFVIRTEKFATLSKKEGDKAAENILRVHFKVANELVSQLHANPPPEAKLYLIYVLGETRDESAVPILLDNIDFKAPFLDEATRIERWGEYPATQALVNIGARSVREISSRLPKDQSEFRRKCMVGVIRGVHGERPGRVFLEDLLAAQKTDEAKANVKKSLEFYDNFGKKK